MSSEKLRISLQAREDRDGRTYYLGKLQFPGVIDCSQGIACLVFTADIGEEELQIGFFDHADKKRDRGANTD